MPIQVERRLSDTHGASSAKQQAQQHHHQQQQQLAHREALRLALGSILTPKRPASASAHHPHSRSASGTASPALSFGGHSLSASGTHTPAEHHLHPHYGATHGHGGYHAAPSRLGPSRSTSSSTPSPASSAQGSAHPSPRVGGAPGTAPGLSPVPAIDPLPPAILPVAEPAPISAKEAMKDGKKPVRPPIMPLHPGTAGMRSTGSGGSAGASDHEHAGSAGDGLPSTMGCGSGSAHASGISTPRAKFLETLQSKRAWDALIHGSFS